MRIDLLHVADCPNVVDVRQRLLDALEATGVDAAVTETEVATVEEAARLGMAGSPTVLIDGHDPFDRQGGGGSLGCRLHHNAAGLDGAPSVAQLIEALTAAQAGRASGGLAGLLGEGLDAVDRALAVRGFAALWSHEARRPEDLVPGVAAAGRAAITLARRGRAELDDAGAVVGIHGLTLRPTRHHFVSRGQSHHTWCAFDSIGIPAALSLDAVAHTDCPVCRRPLAVPITAGVPEPTPAVLWLPAEPAKNLMAQFCSSADLYCTLDHLHQRIDPATAPGGPVDLPDAAELGRQTWADISGVLQTGGR